MDEVCRVQRSISIDYKSSPSGTFLARQHNSSNVNSFFLVPHSKEVSIHLFGWIAERLNVSWEELNRYRWFQASSDEPLAAALRSSLSRKHPRGTSYFIRRIALSLRSPLSSCVALSTQLYHACTVRELG